LKLGVHFKNAIGMWGPYELKKEAFELGVKRKELLDGGTIRYKADDRLTRKDRIAINCSTRWQTWKNFILTADFWGPDSACGASTVLREF